MEAIYFFLLKIEGFLHLFAFYPFLVLEHLRSEFVQRFLKGLTVILYNLAVFRFAFVVKDISIDFEE